MSTPDRAATEAVIRKIVNALDDKKASDIRVINITGKSSVADYLVIATGTSDPHLRGMRIEIEKTLDEAGVRIEGVESQPESGWTVVATFEALVHLFRADRRAYFRIEQLWKDGVELPLANYLSPVAKPEGYVATDAAALKSTKAAAKKPAATKAPAKPKSAAKKKTAPVAKTPSAKKPAPAKAGAKTSASVKSAVVKKAAAKTKPAAKQTASVKKTKAAAKSSKPSAKAGVITRKSPRKA